MEIYDRGLRLKSLREKCGLSQKEVADRLDLTRATISAYERNTKAPRLDVLVGLATLYHSSVDYILGLEHRTNVYIDDLEIGQQKTVEKIIDVLREEFKREKQ